VGLRDETPSSLLKVTTRDSNMRRKDPTDYQPNSLPLVSPCIAPWRNVKVPLRIYNCVCVCVCVCVCQPGKNKSALANIKYK
jgi:hypothetical protein